MKLFSTISTGFDIKKQARELNVSLWQTPTALFGFMGILTIIFMVVVYFTSRNTGNPYILIFSEIGVVTIIFIVGSFVIQLFEELAKTNKTKSEFIAIASHQMRSPLSQMKWMLELFHEKHDIQMKKECKELICQIEGVNSHLIRLAGDLLDVARIDQGETVVVKGKVDVVQVVQEVLKNHEVSIKSKQIHIKTKLHEKTVWVLADEKRLAMVIDNIISNAIKYTRKNGHVEIRSQEMQKGFQICVKDDGIGISEHDQDRVYEKFFRASNTITEEVIGTGLGLYLTKNIMDQLEGKIWFKSIEDVGTLFCVRIPYYNT